MLKFIFGSNTKSVRIINCTIACLWFGILLLGHTHTVQVDIPATMHNHLFSTMLFAVLTVVLSIVSVATKTGYHRRWFKVLSLLVGALFQAITAGYYVSVYPPLDLMLLVCFGFAVWFGLASLYVIKHEGIHRNAKHSS